MFGTIPGNPLAPHAPEKVAGTERVQREDRRDKPSNGRGKSARKRPREEAGGGTEAEADERQAESGKPAEVGDRVDFEA